MTNVVLVLLCAFLFEAARFTRLRFEVLQAEVLERETPVCTRLYGSHSWYDEYPNELSDLVVWMSPAAFGRRIWLCHYARAQYCNGCTRRRVWRRHWRLKVHAADKPRPTSPFEIL